MGGMTDLTKILKNVRSGGGVAAEELLPVV